MNQEETIDSNNELFEHYQFKADKGQEPLRVDKFLINRIENASRNKIQSAAKNGFIFVNQKSVKSNYKVKPGDITKVMFSHPPYENLLIAEEMPLNIIYEDKSLLVINKPPGIVVHPGHGNYNGTLLNGLIHYFKNLPSNEDGRPGLVHRIDKDTSGLLVIAKTEFSMTNLAKQFYLKSSKRKYHALVWGSVQNDEGTINENLARDPKNRLIMSVPEDKELGKNAITHYKVLERFNYVTLLECQLETGRTHQIRAHMKFIGHPIFNDKRYGGDKILKGTIFNKYKQFVQNCFKILPRQALHAKTLGFLHPKSNKEISFESDLPEDFTKCLNKWKNYSNNI
ncbi:MAG: RluA family pseudouridine synthase [Flavobacteriaceae bacterium]|jgi:23S rRNA pseudouridine1911/1915/1917 synthase|nr:RluA family pseudouridine synthase [Flavobacteriaceae bacterium]MBT4958541.1 RluA family pseudouridine synthase [Flavobacteriaceae bacterium]MDG1830212.1 RluA family pseudouridine synthase [Flavobacteriaceae bacterium]